ncbi:MAG: hypothetical protein ACLRMN_00075 [Mediterraneibacter gnavus]
MRKLSFETPDIMDILNHRVIHMDQAVTYCPEYLVTGKMRNYPSRTAQIIGAVYLGELEDSKENARSGFCTDFIRPRRAVAESLEKNRKDIC